MAQTRMTDKEYAKHRSVTRQTVDRWRKRGFLVAHPDGGIHAQASDAILNTRARQYRGGTASAPVGDTTSPVDQGFADLANLPLSECIRRKESALFQTRELALEKLRGRIILVEDIEPGWARHTQNIRAAVLGIPGRARMALQLGATQTEALRRIVRDVLRAAAVCEGDLAPPIKGQEIHAAE